MSVTKIDTSELSEEEVKHLDSNIIHTTETFMEVRRNQLSFGITCDICDSIEAKLRKAGQINGST